MPAPPPAPDPIHAIPDARTAGAPPVCDLAIAGGGLAGGLIALAVQVARPDLSVVLVEGGATLGGNHRWSWFAADLPPRAARLLARFDSVDLGSDHAVRFPAYDRVLATGYRSLGSADFHAGLQRELHQGTIRDHAPIAALDAGGITLASGERIAARAVIDCRGLGTGMPGLTGGWQVFAGRHLRLDRAHGLAHPIIMDATVEQLGGYRFVYVLPLGPRDLFVEDTYYADSPVLDPALLNARIDAYCAAAGWRGETVSTETGVLPVVTGGDFGAFQAAMATPGVAVAGARGGFVHPLTSYTLPHAARIAGVVADHAGLPGPALAAVLEAQGRAHWRATGFYRMLGTMLFGAARPAERYRIFQRFYRLPRPLIERFYAARSTPFDKARLLMGRPPVPIPDAMRALAGTGAPLTLENPA